ncbi:MAG: putative amidohydrolase YtcJ [Bradymonadia bacterium]|jgi:predicted amidohydrolase YtcJ
MRLSGLLSLVAWGSCMSAAAEPADLVLIGDRVVTLTATADATAVAAKDGRITWIGEADAAAAHIGPSTRVLRGGTILPGFIDSHAHLSSLGKALSQVDLVDTASIAAIRATIKPALGAGAATDWVLGRGWDQNDWTSKAFPTAADLDVLSPTRPIAMTRIDGHAIWVNSAALKAAGITAKTPDPAGGKIVRDSTGQATGVLLDEAMPLVRAKIPAPGAAQIRRWIERAVAECHRAGLTGIHDAGTSAADLAVLQAMAAEGALPLRVYAMLMPDDKALAPVFAKGPQIGEFLDARAVKLFGDGALGSRGAWLKAPYSDAPASDPGARGIPIVHGAALARLVARFAPLGFQIGVHAIGDAAAADVLDAYQSVLKPGMDRRFRIEHAQIVSPVDQARMGKLGVIAMVQPTHATSDMGWAEDRLGPARIRHAYAWRSLKRAGVRLSLGSDFPVERPSPIDGISSAVTRQDRQGKPAGGWYADEALTALEAVTGFTADAAFAGFHDGRRGRLQVGFDADFTVLNADPLRLAPSALKTLTVRAVVVAGRVAFVAQ